MEDNSKRYSCINCGSDVKELYKKYSPTVLKLTNCTKCQNVADKYVEYDSVIIIIDLVLLSKEAYRHVIYNTDFKAHWKLAIFLQVIEAYTEWMTAPQNQSNESIQKDVLNLEGVNIGNLQFHLMCLKVSLRTLCFIMSICTFTWIYNKTFRRNKGPEIPMFTVWKSSILSSFGIFLFLPALIWGQSTIQDFHIIFVSLYTTFSQLLAYKVVCNSHKLWSILVILVSYYIKIVFFDNYNTYTKFLKINYNYTSSI